MVMRRRRAGVRVRGGVGGGRVVGEWGLTDVQKEKIERTLKRVFQRAVFLESFQLRTKSSLT